MQDQDGTAYYRQSKDDPDGIVRQREKVRKLASDRGINLTEEFEFEDNDISASKRKKIRPGYEKAMAQAKAGKVLLVSRMDRLYRRLAELEGIIDEVERNGFLILSAEGTYDLTTPAGRGAARIFCTISQQEVEQKAQRQRDANLQDAQQGKRNKTGARPFGWEDDKHTHRLEEADAIAAGADVVVAGGSLQSVVRDWGITRYLRPVLAPFGPLPKGNGWTQTVVRRILLNPQNAGLRVYQGEVMGDGNWTPIILPETQAAVRAVLTDPDRTMPRGAVSLLGGLASCTCSNKIKHGTRTNKHRQQGTPYGIYRCDTTTRDGRPGPHTCVQAAVIDKYVRDVLVETLSRPDAAKAFARKSNGADVLKLREEQRNNARGLAELAGDSAMGIIPRSIYLEAATRINARQDEIEELIAEAGRQDAVALLVGAEDVAATWDGMDVTLRRAVITSLCTRVILKSPGCGCRNPDMEKVVSLRWRT